MTHRKDLKRIVDAGTAVRHSIYSDHRAIFMKIRIARNLAKTKKPSIGRVSRRRLVDPEARALFTAQVEKKLLEIDDRLGEPGSRLGENGRFNRGWKLKKDGKTIQETLQEVLNQAAKTHLVEVSRVNPRWFTAAVLKSCHKRNALQERLHICSTTAQAHCKKRLRRHQNGHKQLVREAKQDWEMLRISKINGNGGSFVGHYWQAVKDLMRGRTKTSKVAALMFKDPVSGIACKTLEKSGLVLVAHLDKLLNAIPTVDDDAIASVEQRVMRMELNDPPLKPEILTAIRRQNNNKACGDSKIPAEFYKACMESPATYAVLEMILLQAWEGEETPIEWVEGRIKMLPKDGDLLDPGRWRSITLLDAVAKIMSTILTNRLNKLLKLHGMEMQNGFTPGRGTVDGSFCVRTLLKKRKEHGLETYGYFLDLVKAFDTVPRESLLCVLSKFGVPSKMVTVIRNMYSGCTVKVEVGEKDFSINATAGVKQGDNLAPVLFLIYIQAVLQTLEKKFPDRKKLAFATKFDHILNGRLPSVKKGLTKFEIGESLYADDAFFGFGTREELDEGAVIIDRHFTSFGLQVHRGSIVNGKKKKSKTECMYCPAQGLYEHGDTTDVQVDNGFYTFTKKFKYLGSIITYDLSADADVKNRIRCAGGAFANLKSILTSKRTELKKRSAIYVSIVVTILLFGSETWGCREDLIRKLEVFHNSCVRQMCHVSRHMQWQEKLKGNRITTIMLNKRVGLPPIKSLLACRQLRWAGHVARMEKTRGPRMLLTAFVQHNRPLGRPVQTFGHSLGKCLRLRANSMSEQQLKQPIDIHVGEDLVRITGQDLHDALKRTTKPVKKDVLTWIDIAQDRDLWRMVVLNNFDVSSVMHYTAFLNDGITHDAYDAIHKKIPRRPQRTKKNKRNKLPKLYAIWTGATIPEGKKKILSIIVDSWVEARPMIFKVSGAQVCSATNNKAGRKHLKYWLLCHSLHSGGSKTLMRRDGKEYFFKRKKE